MKKQQHLFAAVFLYARQFQINGITSLYNLPMAGPIRARAATTRIETIIKINAYSKKPCPFSN